MGYTKFRLQELLCSQKEQLLMMQQVINNITIQNEILRQDNEFQMQVIQKLRLQVASKKDGDP